MTLLDAYALIAFIVGGPATAEVRGILREGGAAVATANLAEALDVSARVYGLSIDQALEPLEPLFSGALDEIPLDGVRARRAATIRSSHYSRRDRPISLGDSILLASGSAGDRIATADHHVLEIAAIEGLEPVPLPSGG